MKIKKSIAAVLAAVTGFVILGVPAEATALEIGDLEVPEAIIFHNKAELTVYVDGKLSGTLSRTCDAGEVVTLEAPEQSKDFSYWAVSLGTDSEAAPEKAEKAGMYDSYTLAVNADVTLYAVYDAPAVKEPAAAFTAAVQNEYLLTGKDTIRLTANFSVPDDNTASEAGIIYTDNRLLTGRKSSKDLIEEPVKGIDVKSMLTGKKTSKKVRKVSAKRIPEGGFDWSLAISSPGDDTPVYAVSYVKVDGKTYYSDVMTLTYNSRTKGVAAVYDIPQVINSGDDTVLTGNDLDKKIREGLANLNLG